VSFEEGVAQMLTHIENWRDAPVWTPDTIAEATTGWFKYLSK
jgi:UDP-glucose 4-epimerase